MPVRTHGLAKSFTTPKQLASPASSGGGGRTRHLRGTPHHPSPHTHGRTSTTPFTAAPTESKDLAVQAQAPPAEAAAVEGEMLLAMPEDLPKVTWHGFGLQRLG